MAAMTAMPYSPAASGLGPPPGGADPRATSAMGASRGSEKRTFKEKLHNLIQEAEAAEVQAFRDSQLQDRKSLSIQLLVEGRPQAFVDFFGLTHGRQPGGSGQSTSGQQQQQQPEEDVPQEALGLLRNELLKADTAMRTGDAQAVYAAYKSLAKHFAQLGRLRKAEFFFRRCLRLSQDTQWLAGELEANLALGVVYEELQATGAAIGCYERRLQLAGEHQMQLEQDTAYHNLTAVYMRQAEVQESSGEPATALESYNKCLSAAERTGDAATAARANFRMGMLYHQQAKHQEALHHLRAFIELAPALADKPAEGLAYTTYAACLKALGDRAAAVRCLEEYLQMARGGDQQGPAMASCSLGIMLFEQGDLEQAVTFFEKFFETARTLSDRKMLDVARVNLGVARGSLRMRAYMGIVAHDLPALIAWKSSRMPFGDH